MPTFAEALYTMPTERLRAMAILRKLEPQRLAMAPDKRQLVQLMATELTKPPSIAHAVLHCNARELRLLQLLISIETRQSISWKVVTEAAGGKSIDSPLRDVLVGLESLGLALHVGESVLLPEPVRHQVPTSLADHYTVAGCLNGYDAPTLRTMAERLGTGGGTKAENIEAIARRLLYTDSEMFGAIVLDAEEQSVVDYLMQSGGGATAVEVASAALGATDDFFRYDWQNRWKMGKERNAIDRLLACGMVYVVSYAYGFNLFLVIPGDLLRALTGESRAAFWTSPVPAPAPASAEITTTRRHTSLIRDVVALFGYVTTQEAVRTNTGYIHKTSLKNMARIFSIQDERYAGFVYSLCRQHGMIAPQSEKGAYGVTQKGHAWLDLSPFEQLQELYLAWRGGEFWGEMYSDPLKRSNEYRPQDAVVSVRDAALGLIADTPTAGFTDVGSLTDALSYRHPLLLAQSTRLGGDLVPSPSNFVRLLVGESLYWLGFVELGWTSGPQFGAALIPPTGEPARPAVGTNRTPNPDGPGTYRLTPEGAYLFGSSDAEPPETPPSESQFIVQANSEIFLPPYLEASTLFHLLLISETPGKAASGNIVSITRESIRRALDQGITGRETIEFLRSHARTGIPQNVEYLINEVGEKHGHIHIGRAHMYLQVDSPLVLKELQARRELKGYFVRTLGDTVAILNAPEPDKLLRELRKAGYLPISDDAPKGAGIRLDSEAAANGRTTASPPVSKRKAIAKTVESVIDWDRIAESDGRSWRETNAAVLPEAQPQDAVRDKGNIRFLLLEAIQTAKRVQVAYKAQGDAQPQIRLMEPHRVMSNFVFGYLPNEAEEVTYNINRIDWVRATAEAFVPP